MIFRFHAGGTCHALGNDMHDDMNALLFNRYGHTDIDTDMAIPIYSKPIPIPILPSRIYIKPIPISVLKFISNRYRYR